MLAVLRVRGRRKVRPKVEKTLELLLLNRPNHCVLIEDTDQNIGMLNVVKDYITYGPIDEETIYKLLYKRGKVAGERFSAKHNEEAIRKVAKEIFSGKKTKDYVNPVFRLSPPSKGYKSVKKNYPEGDLGKREAGLSSLIRRMV